MDALTIQQQTLIVQLPIFLKTEKVSQKLLIESSSKLMQNKGQINVKRGLNSALSAVPLCLYMKVIKTLFQLRAILESQGYIRTKRRC